MPQQFQWKWIIPIFILGCLTGALLIAPFLNLQITPDASHTNLLHETAKILHIPVENFAGAILGGLIALFLIPLIFYKDPEIKRGFKILEIGGRNQFTHPTTLPLTIAFLWFLLSTVGVTFLIPNSKQLPDYLTIIVFIPLLFLVGFSGFQMVKRNETVGRFGIIHKGFWAYLSGGLFIAFGWGSLLYLTLALVFNW